MSESLGASGRCNRAKSRWILPIVLYLTFSGTLPVVHFARKYKRMLRYDKDVVKHGIDAEVTNSVQSTPDSAAATATITSNEVHNRTNTSRAGNSSNETNLPNSVSTLPTVVVVATETPTNSSNTSLPHPHAGARDSNGALGYIADVTMVRRWMLQRIQQQDQISNNNKTHTEQSYMPFRDAEELQEVCGDPPGQGSEGKAGYDLLVNHIELAREDFMKNSNGKNSDSEKMPKILCVVYTYERKHLWVQAITDTWGWRCDGFFAASTKTVVDPTIAGFGAIDLPHLGTESYNTMWQKTRSIMGYLYDNYLEEYDFFLVGGDDMHVIVENMRTYLKDLEKEQIKNGRADEGVILGHHTRRRRSGPVYVGGGPGYVLNKAALKQFGENGLATCEADVFASAEDFYISMCMRSLGVKLVDTADSEGRQRFQGLTAEWIASENPWETKSWLLGLYSVWEDEGHGRRWGKNVTSPQSVSFHALKTPILMRRHHAVLYKSCPLGTPLGDALSVA